MSGRERHAPQEDRAMTLDRTDHNLHKRAKCVAELRTPGPWGSDFLDVWRAGSKRDGYVYAISTMSEGTFRWLWLTDGERTRIIEALGGDA